MKYSEDRSGEALGSILRNSWERMPNHLERKLMGIPEVMKQERVLLFSRLQMLLELLILIWGFGSAFLYRSIWLPWITRLGSNLAPDASILAQLSLNPICLALIVGLLGLGVWFLEQDRLWDIHSRQ